MENSPPEVGNTATDLHDTGLPAVNKDRAQQFKMPPARSIPEKSLLGIVKSIREKNFGVCDNYAVAAPISGKQGYKNVKKVLRTLCLHKFPGTGPLVALPRISQDFLNTIKGEVLVGNMIFKHSRNLMSEEQCISVALFAEEFSAKLLCLWELVLKERSNGLSTIEVTLFPPASPDKERPKRVTNILRCLSLELDLTSFQRDVLNRNADEGHLPSEKETELFHPNVCSLLKSSSSSNSSKSTVSATAQEGQGNAALKSRPTVLLKDSKQGYATGANLVKLPSKPAFGTAHEVKLPQPNKKGTAEVKFSTRQGPNRLDRAMQAEQGHESIFKSSGGHLGLISISQRGKLPRTKIRFSPRSARERRERLDQFASSGNYIFNLSTHNFILKEVQKTLEHSVFDWLSKNAPQLLGPNDWLSPESLELNRCLQKLKKGDVPGWQPPFIGKESWYKLHDEVMEIRHTAVHRQAVDNKQLIDMISVAMNLADYMGDARAARLFFGLRLTVVGKDEVLVSDCAALKRLLLADKEKASAQNGDSTEKIKQLEEENKESIDDVQTLLSKELLDEVKKLLEVHESTKKSS